ncbi:family 10 glycosylhydrolase [Pseudonocardia sp. DSM 110487]|uniref:glycoside hydrolase family 10 protein n=1 Tax=Pseudonocardia sp. DSM 110487 TaxID=2865833 RepID=UPI001C6A8E25|nr:family 10 glycosylhydrolase [Pseudonocardia sp. DSM 110487]QYN37090.1 family 10 glycosylhydrolase [Pseudonocardia sp. DSM 110487]
MRARVVQWGVAALALALGVWGVVPTDPPASCAGGETRAVWIATVQNIDWPSKPGLPAAEQQREYRTLLDDVRRHGLNTVIVQVRPTADALWPSPYEPWSHWLTGEQGKDPGYDPLAFLVDEAHARGLKFHAWFNPFRVSRQADPAQLVPEHPARQHPDWAFAYGGQLYYDPGKPAVREFVTDVVLDVAQRYAIDGVHFDDYFYPYPVEGEQIPDAGTFAAYGGGTDVADWRRQNIDELVKGVSERLSALDRDIAFGISPFGIWRNEAADPRGSATTGIQSYDTTYADSWTWVRQGWVDYIVPQIYWEIGHPSADYAALVPWWAGVVAGTRVQLYTGQAAYKVGGSPAWGDGELAAHLTLDREHAEVRGQVYFSAHSLSTNAAAAMERVKADHYSCPPTGNA